MDATERLGRPKAGESSFAAGHASLGPKRKDVLRQRRFFTRNSLAQASPTPICELGGKEMSVRCALIAIACQLAFGVIDADEAPRPIAPESPELRDELVRRTKEDQDARTAMVKWQKAHGSAANLSGANLSAERLSDFLKVTSRVKKADAENTKWLKQIVRKNGWPTYSMVGKDGGDAAWLLVQHADAEVKFQRKCLDLMTKLSKEEVSLSNVAYLTDRVLLAEGEKQLYGTQFNSVDGKFAPRPIEDEANVDRRRAAVGLPPLAEYAQQLQQHYGPSEKKDE